MVEESLEAFVQRWRAFAAEARLFARPEGSPLLEAAVHGAILQLFERTNPYLGTPGSAHVVVHPVTDRVQRTDTAEKRLEVPSRGALRARGLVLEREDPILVVDAGAPLVAAVEETPDPSILAGEWVTFDAAAPIHGFVLPRRRVPSAPSSTDDAL